MTIRVMLADDHQILREALRTVLENEPDIEVVAEARDGIEATELARKHRPDLVVMDVGMPRMDGIAATRSVLTDNPEIRVVGLSTYSDKRIAQQMLSAGASAYVIKASGGDQLLLAIRAAIAGEVYLCPEIAANLAAGVRHGGAAEPASAKDRRLGKREREVLQLLIDGRSVAEVGEQLHIATATVEAHRSHIMRKLDLHSPAEFSSYTLGQRNAAKKS